MEQYLCKGTFAIKMQDCKGNYLKKEICMFKVKTNYAVSIP